MERLKTPAEKRADFAEHSELERREFEKHKPCIIRLINDCTRMPVRLCEKYGIDVSDLEAYLSINGVRSINDWLVVHGYRMVEICTDSGEYYVIDMLDS
jgi:hypothetical protein